MYISRETITVPLGLTIIEILKNTKITHLTTLEYLMYFYYILLHKVVSFLFVAKDLTKR